MLSALLLAAWTLYPKNDALSVIRVNLLGYAPAGDKTAVLCSLQPRNFDRFALERGRGTVVYTGRARAAGPYGPCVSAYALDFSTYRTPGSYRIVAGGISSPAFRIAQHPYAGVPGTLLNFMRDERSGYNPLFHAYVHQHDGIDVANGKYYDVRGGWADAADELQYVDTSATATFGMMMAFRDHPTAFGNGGRAVLSEIRHGLDWLVKMYPKPGLMFNQLGDDRDHRTFHVFTDDQSDYGWGKGGARPIYPCTGRPQGLFKFKNRSTGIASTAGKFASAFALGAQLYARRAPAYARLLARKAREAYRLGQLHPGVCQTAPATEPYYYMEDDYADDMELAAAELYTLTHRKHYLREALAYAAMQPVKPWMGADVAEHYQWYPFLNAGHYEIWRATKNPAIRRLMVRYYREGLQRVAARAQNPFRIGFPFLWVSNDLAIAYATQAYLYRQMSGDRTYEPYENAARNWLFGENFWGTSFVIGVPASGPYPKHPQSIEHRRYRILLRGAVVDGPVYRTVYEELKGIKLERPDRYAPFNSGFAVYHDDFWDYSTNEPVMSTTADLIYLMAAQQ